MACTARIEPFVMPYVLACERENEHEGMHRGVVRDVAWPGSETAIEWAEEDRRNYHVEETGET